jgi:hypothetical protein
MIARSLCLVAVLLVGAWSAAAEATQDYRNRTIYFIVTDRFHPRQPYDPYVDPEHPLATNTRNCFTEACPFEEEWRRYWGGDIRGIIQKLDYLERLGVSALWLTPLMENVRAYEPSRFFHAWGAAYQRPPACRQAQGSARRHERRERGECPRPGAGR